MNICKVLGILSNNIGEPSSLLLFCYLTLKINNCFSDISCYTYIDRLDLFFYFFKIEYYTYRSHQLCRVDISTQREIESWNLHTISHALYNIKINFNNDIAN